MLTDLDTSNVRSTQTNYSTDGIELKIEEYVREEY